MQRYSLLFYCLLAVSFPWCQELIFNQFELNNTLPSTETYSIIQDRKGYLWIATEEGFCKYSKGKIEVFNKKNGVPEKAVYASAIAEDGKLWIGTSENRYLYYDGKIFKETPFQKKINAIVNKHMYGKTSFPLSITPAADGLYFHSTFVVAKVNPAGKTSSFPKVPPGTAMFLNRPGKPLALLNWQLKYPPGQILIDKVVLKDPGGKEATIPIGAFSSLGNHYTFKCVTSKGKHFIAMAENLVVINPDHTSQVIRFPMRITAVNRDKDGGVWVGLVKYGVYYFPDVNNLDYRIHSLRKYTVTGICHDNEKGTWCTTLEKGVFYCANKSIVGFPGEPALNNRGSLLRSLQNRLYFSSNADQVFMLDQYGLHKYPTKISWTYQIADLYCREKDILAATNIGLIVFQNNFSKHSSLHNKIYRTMTANKIAGSSDSAYFASYGSVYATGKTGRKLNFSLFYFDGKLKQLLVTDNKLLFYGGKSFLHVLRLSDHKSIVIQNIQGEVTDIFQAKKGEILVSIRNSGILRIDLKTYTAVPLNTKLPEMAVTYDIDEDPYGNLWVASNVGLLKLTPNKTGYSCTNYTIKHGLPSNVVNKIAINRNLLYFSTDKGLFYFDPRDEFIDKTVQNIYLDKLLVNEKEYQLTNRELELDHNDNNLRFIFDITASRPEVAVNYELTNENGLTSEHIDGGELSLMNLAPGSYKLVVHILNNDGFESKYPWKLYIVIHPPFWLTGWFLSLSLIALVFLIVVIVVYIIKRIKRREELKTQTSQLLADYQMSALQAQMNPHFIFNAINTIQGYIISQDKDEAYNYLTQFSKLIRMVLHHSQEKNVPLDDELEMLRLYIELEQLRFDHCFDYILEISDEVDIHEAFIPSMVLQPFIENAIWHGIINLKKSRQGLLKLSLSQQEEVLLIVIEDNGVGRKQAASYKTSAHKSVALSVTRQRVEILNKQHQTGKTGLEITDLFSEKGEPAGTRVEIHLPLLFD